jgi:hypothetical protein
METATMDAHPDAVMPTSARHASTQSRIESAPRDRDDAQAQLRARLLQMIVANEKLRKASNESTRPR